MKFMAWYYTEAWETSASSKETALKDNDTVRPRVSRSIAKTLGAVARQIVCEAEKELRDMKRELHEVRKAKKGMSLDDCKDFLFRIITNPVLFVDDEAVEAFAFLNDDILEKIDRDDFSLSGLCHEDDTIDLCRMVVKVAWRHFEKNYRGKFEEENHRHALSSVVDQWVLEV